MVDEPRPPPVGTPYSVWQALGLFLLIFVVQNTLGGLIALVFAFGSGHGSAEAMTTYVPQLASNGLFVGVSTLVAAPVCVGLIWLFAGLRPGMTARALLALHPVRLRTLALWLGLTTAFILLNALVNFLTGHPEVPQFALDTYRTAGWLPLLVLAFVVLAPVFEELLFRGWLFAGLVPSALGAWGTVLLTSLLFATLHLQYDVHDIISIFILGLLLGAARVRTRSTLTPVVMHACINLVSTVQVVLKVQGWF